MSLPPLINGKFQQPKQLQLEPLQLGALLVIDGCAVALQTGANQLGGFLGLKREADLLLKALGVLQVEKEQLMADWQRKLVVAPASALVNGGKVG